MAIIEMDKEQVKSILKKEGYIISEESRMGNNLGTVLKLNTGCIINCWDKGTINVQGKNVEEIKILLNHNCGTSRRTHSNQVFVVYGHDNNSRVQLEAMLRRWELEPLILDQLVSSGQTIIEKLEEYIGKADFGIVLATPDDIGASKDDMAKGIKKYRVRQNVILEMGMLLAKIGREKVAILLSQKEDMESPSDIQGLLYIPFKENVEEVKVSLAKEMNCHGYCIDVKNL